MPVENERKYILDLSIDQLEKICKEFNGKEQEIKQSYIKDGRIRRISSFTRNIGVVVITYKYIFTWKYTLNDGTLIEIETEINWRDYERLCKESKNLITKRRVKFEFDNMHWDLDFLLSGSKHYITIAECEMPEGMDAPAKLPQFVNDTLIFLVPRSESKKWTNKRLTNSKKTIKMVNTVRDNENG